MAGSLAFVAIGIVMVGDTDASAFWAWFGLIFFGLCAIVFFIVSIRPFMLRLDRDGFTLNRGLRIYPHFVAWGDVEEIFVHAVRTGHTRTRMVGFNFRPGQANRTAWMKLNRTLGADGALPALWEEDPDHLVELMNAYLREHRDTRGGS
ncbi:MAG: hypothetical protein CL808_06525 [Citromicrobium sp.]|nr:hypothetical protein [Citromicrobium sp.]